LQTGASEKTSESHVRFDIQDTTTNKKHLSANGYFYPNRADQNFDIRVSVFDMDLSFLRNYVQTFSSSVTGKFGGELTLDGPMKKPNLYGDLVTRDAVLKVDYLNTFYALTCKKIAFSLDKITFESASLQDVLHKTQSTLTGGLHHQRFKNFRLNLNFGMTNFFVLNTSEMQNEVFFGKAFVTGTAHLGSSAETVLINVDARTERGTEIKIIQNLNANISSDNQYINFVSPKKDIDTVVNTPVVETQSSNLIVKLNIEATPNASFNFNMDVPPIGGIINASGSGSLQLNYESRGNLFTMFGDYVLQDGYYDFSFDDKALGRLITRRFLIERGGNIQWMGEPANMILDISAVFSTRASLAPILVETGSLNEIPRRVNVQSVISIDGQLSRPDIRFDFRLPNVEDDVRTRFFSVVNKDDEHEMTKQTFYLLLFGSFTTPGNNATVGFAGADINTASMAFDILAGQVNNILQNFSDNINLGVNFRPEDINTTQQTQVSLGTQFFDSRLLIDGNFSHGGLLQNPLTPAGQPNTLELNLEWRITDRFSFKAFQRPSDRDLAPSGHLQGAGIAYKREFDSFRSLFSRRRRKEKD
jgi:hypothetical protein